MPSAIAIAINSTLEESSAQLKSAVGCGVAVSKARRSSTPALSLSAEVPANNAAAPVPYAAAAAAAADSVPPAASTTAHRIAIDRLLAPGPPDSNYSPSPAERVGPAVPLHGVHAAGGTRTAAPLTSGARSNGRGWGAGSSSCCAPGGDAVGQTHGAADRRGAGTALRSPLSPILPASQASDRWGGDDKPGGTGSAGSAAEELSESVLRYTVEGGRVVSIEIIPAVAADLACPGGPACSAGWRSQGPRCKARGHGKAGLR